MHDLLLNGRFPGEPGLASYSLVFILHQKKVDSMAALCNTEGHYIFCPVVSFFFFSSPNLIGWRLDVYHTSTHGVALVRI